MTSQMTDVETAMRARECFHGLTVPPGMWTVLRVDGRGFSRLTKARYSKPYDDGFHEHMLTTARALVDEFPTVYGYTQSDEISIVVPPSAELFGRRVEKLVSISASAAAATFTLACGEVVHFDSRVWVGATVDDVIDYFRWRQADAHRSALQNWCYWTLRDHGHSASQAHNALLHEGVLDKLQILAARGIVFDDVPAWQRRGTGLHFTAYEHVGHNPMTGQDVTVTRRRLDHTDDLPSGLEYDTFLRGVLDPA